MTLNDFESQNRGFWRFFVASQTLGVNCDEMAKDRLKQFAHELFSSMESRFCFDLLGLKSSPYGDLKLGYCFKMHYYLIALCTLIYNVSAPMLLRVTWTLLKLLVVWYCIQLSLLNKICLMFIRTRSLSNAFRYFTARVRINIISELLRLRRKKSKCLISNCTAAMLLLSFFAISITKKLTLSVTWPFDLSLALYYKWSIVTMCLSCTVMEIWRFKHNGLTTLTFWGHVTSKVTLPFDSRWSTSYGWSIVIMRPLAPLRRYKASNVWRTHARTDGLTDAQVILYSVQCALHWIYNYVTLLLKYRSQMHL